MILSQVDLRKAVKTKKIVFSPEIEEKQWGEASVDLRLGHSFTKLQNAEGLTVSVAEGLQVLAGTQFFATKECKDADVHGEREVFVLKPGQFVLAMTYESITVPRNMIALVEGRSTYARVGLSMHQTAPWIQPGWSGPIVLEIMNNGPLNITLTPMVDRPCQVTFFELRTPLPAEKAYGTRVTDRYQNQVHPLKHEKRGEKKR